MRGRYQVLVIPFMFINELLVSIFQRSDDGYWQFIAGGGEIMKSRLKLRNVNHGKKQALGEVQKGYEFVNSVYSCSDKNKFISILQNEYKLK